MAIDRSHVAKCLAKALAFKAVGNREEEARDWARKLIEALELAEILAPYEERESCPK